MVVFCLGVKQVFDSKADACVTEDPGLGASVFVRPRWLISAEAVTSCLIRYK